MATTFIKSTLDGRRVEVIDGAICLDGRFEAKELIQVAEHPNRQAILQALPGATHMAGRLPLTAEEATKTQDAMFAEKRAIDLSPQAIDRRLREAMFYRAKMEGIE